MIIVVLQRAIILLIAMIMSLAIDRGAKEKTTRVGTISICKNRQGVEFHLGDVVRLSPKAFSTYNKVGEEFAGREITEAKIEYFFPGIKGLAKLDKRLGGYWTWDVNDLIKVKDG